MEQEFALKDNHILELQQKILALESENESQGKALALIKDKALEAMTNQRHLKAEKELLEQKLDHSLN